eukprot:1924214-Rhodomonas_salina.13
MSDVSVSRLFQVVQKQTPTRLTAVSSVRRAQPLPACSLWESRIMMIQHHRDYRTFPADAHRDRDSRRPRRQETRTLITRRPA